jgi:hypothetical protein
MELKCKGLAGNLCHHLLPFLESAAKSLDLAADFSKFTLVVDDLPDARVPWLHLERSSDPAEARLGAILFCAESNFSRLSPATSTVFPSVEIWDQAPAPRHYSPFDLVSFSQDRTQAFLHHELLLARDLVRGEIVPSALANGQIEAFSATWAVTVDGRLSRLGLPGYTMPHRRSQFSHLFSNVGVLLPDHWQIFQSLWDGGLVGWKDVLAVIRHLPRL